MYAKLLSHLRVITAPHRTCRATETPCKARTRQGKPRAPRDKQAASIHWLLNNRDATSKRRAATAGAARIPSPPASRRGIAAVKVVPQPAPRRETRSEGSPVRQAGSRVAPRITVAPRRQPGPPSPELPAAPLEPQARRGLAGRSRAAPGPPSPWRPLGCRSCGKAPRRWAWHGGEGAEPPLQPRPPLTPPSPLRPPPLRAGRRRQHQRGGSPRAAAARRERCPHGAPCRAVRLPADRLPRLEKPVGVRRPKEMKRGAALAGVCAGTEVLRLGSRVPLAATPRSVPYHCFPLLSGTALCSSRSVFHLFTLLCVRTFIKHTRVYS